MMNTEKNTQNISIKDFVTKYNMIKDKGKIVYEYIRSYIKREYVPYAEKAQWANKVITVTCHNKDGLTVFNGVKLHMNFVYATLEMYFNFNIDYTGGADDYDRLQKYGLVNELISMYLPGEEINEWKAVWNMTLDDIRTNELSPQVYIASQITRLTETMGLMGKLGIDALKKYISSLDNKQLKQITDMLKELTKTVK